MNEIELKLKFIRYCLLGIITDKESLNNIFFYNKYPDENRIKELLNCSIPEKRMEGYDQPPNALSMIGVKRMENLHNMLEYVRLNNIEGDLIETGVWRGGATIYMKIYSDLYKLNKKVFVCDSFEGLPKPSGKYPSDNGDLHHTFSILSVSLDQVIEYFKKYQCLDENVVFIKGFFSQTLPNNNQIGQISLLRMDGDMYESTHDVFYSLYDKIIKNGVVIIDDYCLKGCKDCVNDYRKTNNIQNEITVIDRCGIYWIK